LAEKYHRKEDKNELYTHIKSAAESGWNFSSRWFITANDTNNGRHPFTTVKSIKYNL